MPTKNLQKSTTSTEFIPTPTMETWLDTAIKLMSISQTAIATESGLDRTNWYHWQKLDGFQDWFLSEYRRRRQVILPELDAIGMKYARKGEYAHWRDMNRKVGELLDDKVPDNVKKRIVAEEFFDKDNS